MIFRWLRDTWDAVTRSSDMSILWPICRQTEDLERAKAVFYFHIANDPAWTDHYTEAELVNFVDALT